MDAAQQRLFVLQKTKSPKSMFLKDKITGELLSLSDQTWRPGPEVPENITLSSSHLKILQDQKVGKYEKIFDLNNSIINMHHTQFDLCPFQALLAGVGNMSSQVRRAYNNV